MDAQLTYFKYDTIVTVICLFYDGTLDTWLFGAIPVNL